MEKFKYSEGLPGGANEIKISGMYSGTPDVNAILQSSLIFHAGGPHTHGAPVNNSGPRAEVNETKLDKDAMNAMMKARLAYEENFGNRAAKRMVAPVDNAYDFGDGVTGTHYMSSMDKYAIPQIQDVNGNLEMIDDPGAWNTESKAKEFIRPNEIFRFETEDEADYFANENYKRVSPMFIQDNVQKFLKDYNPQQMYKEGGGYFSEEEKAKRKAKRKGTINANQGRGFGTVSHGEINSEADLERMYPGKSHLPEYQALLNRDTQLVNNPGRFIGEADNLSNANYGEGIREGDHTQIGAIPVRFDENGKAIGYATDTSTAGYTHSNSERPNVVNFPATAGLLSDMNTGKTSNTDRVQFVQPVNVPQERPAWMPENMERSTVNAMDTLGGLYKKKYPNREFAREDLYNAVQSGDGMAELDSYYDDYENRTGHKISQISNERQKTIDAGVSGWDIANDFVTNPGIVLQQLALGKNPYANSSMSINERQNMGRDIFENTGDAKYLTEGTTGRYGEKTYSNTNSFNPAGHFQNSMDNYNSGRKEMAAWDAASGLLSLSPLTTGSLLSTGVKNEIAGIAQGGKGLWNAFKGQAGNLSKVKDFASNALKTQYHMGKAYALPSVYGHINNAKNSVYNNEDMGGIGYAELGADALNAVNPFKIGSLGFGQVIARGGKDIIKSGVSGYKSLTEEEDQTKNALKTLGYSIGAVVPQKNFGKYLTKTINRHAGDFSKEIQPLKNFVNNKIQFDQRTYVGPDGPITQDGPMIQADNYTGEKTGKVLQYGGGITNGPVEQLKQQKKKMINIIDSPMYLQTLKKQFPNYTAQEIVEERTNRLNALLMG